MTPVQKDGNTTIGVPSFTEVAPFVEERDEDITFNLQDRAVSPVFTDTKGAVTIIDIPIKPGKRLSNYTSIFSTAKKQRRIIPMSLENQIRIAEGKKTTTIRTQTEADKINIKVGETEQREIGGNLYNITNRGYLTIREAGGLQAMLKSEGVESEKFLKYQHTKDWIAGEGRLYVYDIRPINEEGEDPINCK